MARLEVAGTGSTMTKLGDGVDPEQHGRQLRSKEMARRARVAITGRLAGERAEREGEMGVRSGGPRNGGRRGVLTVRRVAQLRRRDPAGDRDPAAVGTGIARRRSS
jgi:hypothetical protein